MRVATPLFSPASASADLLLDPLPARCASKMAQKPHPPFIRTPARPSRAVVSMPKPPPLAFILLGTCSVRWASLVAQMVRNLPAVQETRVQSLGREDPLEKGNGSILAKNVKDRAARRATVHGVTKSQTRQSNVHVLPPPCSL